MAQPLATSLPPARPSVSNCLYQILENGTCAFISLWPKRKEESLSVSAKNHFLRFCDSSLVSLEVFSPAQILLIVQRKAMHHSIFLSPLFLCFFLLEFRSLALYVPSVLFCVLLSLLAVLSILLFFSTLLSIPCFVYSFSVYSLYFLISLIFSFSNLLSLLFSFLYSICSTLMCYYYWNCSLSLVKTGINFKKT